MSRKYIKIDEYRKQILEMKAQGKTSREIAQALGVDRECIRNWVFRFNRQQRKLEAGIKLQPKGRPRKDAQPREIITEQAYEIQRLKMENELLRDFMRSVGRRWNQTSNMPWFIATVRNILWAECASSLRFPAAVTTSTSTSWNIRWKIPNLPKRFVQSRNPAKRHTAIAELWLDSEGIVKNPKTILRIMHKYF